ncbi:MAG: sugar transferase, partial [Gemmatimonadetes bacterium]|nr:sugar transferase [Gemmatimonadota bacterium]
RAFTMYKFRTMMVNAETSGAVWASKNDTRITPIGGLLRGTRLDELPQLVNVLRGDMNVVGPRPERPSIFMQLRKEIDRYHLRQRAKPGITGWAQINQNYDTSIDDVRRKVEFDLAYIERRSVVEDMRIMAKTLPVMIFRKGAH